MRKLLFALALLGACSTSPSTQVQVKAVCALDATLAPALAASGATIAVAVDPVAVPEVIALGAADQVAHAAVQAACASVGGTPVAVTTAPVAAP